MGGPYAFLVECGTRDVFIDEIRQLILNEFRRAVVADCVTRAGGIGDGKSERAGGWTIGVIEEVKIECDLLADCGDEGFLLGDWTHW